jgi:4'-phosphopantetheinyl transferase EntD
VSAAILSVAALARVPLYPIAFAFDTTFGRCVGVDLAAALAADPASVTAQLHPAERMLALAIRGARLVEFTGGRVASRLARSGMPGADRPTLSGEAGLPTVKGGVSVSISHTRRFAVALANAEAGSSIGIDIEPLDEAEAGDLLAERILSDDERAADLRGEAIGILQRLSLKEAAYKALFPRFGHIRLREIAVLRTDGAMRGFRVAAPGDTTVAVEFLHLHGHILSFARVT